VGDREVDAAQALGQDIDRGRQPRRVAHVGDRRLGPGDRGRDGFQRRSVDVDQAEPHAAAGELAGELGADAGSAAGDERHAPVEVPGHCYRTLKRQVGLRGDERIARR
jgi:hypothetical protein